MAAKKRIYCRFEGCTHKKGFTSRAGRLYHERTKHGRAFTDKKDGALDGALKDKPEDLKIDPVIKPNTGGQFVKIEDVKFVMAKNKKEPKTDEDGEYENECGKCGHEFNGTSKFCPECGVEFK